MARKKYKASTVAPFDKSKVQIYGECLDEIAEEKGSVTPQDVLEEARDEDSPLHEVFDWDDTKAAESWRIYQARQLINHITIEIKWDHTKKEVRAFHSIKDTSEEAETSRIYVTLNRVLTEPEIRKQVIADAFKEVEGWRIKYEQYRELGLIVKTIKQTKKKLKKKKLIA